MQQSLFFDNDLEALKATCQAIKGGQSAVALDLWPSMNPDSSKAKLSNCLNPNKTSEKLTTEEKMFIAKKGKEYGINYYMQFLAQELGYEEPKPLDEEKAKQDMMEQIIENQKRNTKMIERLLSSSSQIQAVS